MTLRASIVAATAAALFFMPGAVRAETCADQVTGSLGDQGEVAATLGLTYESAAGLTFGRAYLQYTIAQAVLAKQDADNLDTLDAFLPPGDTKAHTALQTMREKKKAQVEHFMADAERIRAKLEQMIAAMCARAAAEAAREHADELNRAAFGPGPNDNDGPPPPDSGPYAGQPPDNGPPDDEPPPPPDSPRSGNGDAGAALIGGLLLGGAIAAGAGGGHHHHDGGGSNGPGCH